MIRPKIAATKVKSQKLRQSFAMLASLHYCYTMDPCLLHGLSLADYLALADVTHDVVTETRLRRADDINHNIAIA